MPCHTRMKLLLRGIFWLFILEFGSIVTSLEPGFLDFDNLPDTNFSCVGKVIGGYYADLETSCQMFHVCTIGQLDEPMDIRFLCLNGTVFDQETRVCERIDEVDCSKSEQFYSLNLELYGNTQPPILEESPETEVPEVLQKSATTTTTTTSRPTVAKTTRQSFIITTSKSPQGSAGLYGPQNTATPHAVPGPLPTVQIPQPPKPPQPQPQLHFGSRPSADIRFNPEEYKIALSSSGPPTIRTNVNVKPNTQSANPKPSDNQSAGPNKPISFQTFSDNNKRVIVTTHTTVYKTEKQPLHVVTVAPSKVEVTSQQPEDSEEQEESESEEHDYDVEPSDSTEDNYSYGYRHHSQNRPSEALKPAYTTQGHTETPFKQYRPDIRDFRPNQALSPPIPQPLQQPLPPLNLQEYKASTYRSVFHPASNNPLKVNYNHRGLSGGSGPTTYRNHYGYFNQASIPVPVQVHHKPEKHLPRPSIPPLTFSSPAPFSLSRHVETKRFIDHRIPQQIQQASQQLLNHHQPPRIVISASASVSDASGRKFNYSLGTIGDSRFFGNAPQSYDDYKEDDVGLDPFYHDVPKIRTKRQVPDLEKLDEAIGEKEAIDVLKFLFNWYNNHEKNTPGPLEKKGIPVRAETITEINDALSESPFQIDSDNPQSLQDDQDTARDYVYEDFDFHRPSDYAGVPQKKEGKPYLSLQLLKPPFTQSEPKPPQMLHTEDVPNFRSLKSREKQTTTTTRSPELNYYDYVDDNFEPLVYKHDYGIPGEDVKESGYPEKETKVKDQKEGQRLEVPKQTEHPETRLKESYQDQINETDPNYFLPDYVDDNYEPLVYQHKEIEKNAFIGKDKGLGNKEETKNIVVGTTSETFTTLKDPLPQEENYSKSVPTSILRVEPERVSSKPIDSSPPEEPIFPIYNRYQMASSDFAKPETFKTTEATPTLETESYKQVLGILGITTRKPNSENPSEQRGTKRPRGHNRGKARFSFKDIDVPLDKVLRKSTTTKAPPPSTKVVEVDEPSTIIITETPKVDTTTELRYTTNVERRTEEVGSGIDTVIPTEILSTTEQIFTPERVGDSGGKEEQIFMQGIEGRLWEKLGESTIATGHTTEEIEVTSKSVTDIMTEVEETTSSGYTTEAGDSSMGFKKLVEKVEASTGGVVVAQVVQGEKIDETTIFEGPTTVVPIQGKEELEERLETTMSYPTTITTSVPTTFSTFTTSPIPTTTHTVNPSSRNSRRRSKSRFRVPTSTPTSIYSSIQSTTEFPTSLSFSSSTSPTPTIPTIPTTPATLTILTTSETSSTSPETNHPFRDPIRIPSINEEIIGAIKHNMPKTDGRNFEFNINAYTANLAYRVKTTPLTLVLNEDPQNLSSPNHTLEDPTPSPTTTGPPPTDPPIPRSAQPTLSNENITRRGHHLPTTPISQSTAINIRKQVKHQKYTFNCVDKEVDRFYSDPRDCRLFHYCTRGFTRTQYLDMKFVCDLGTFFDDIQLVCTKAKPERCVKD